MQSCFGELQLLLILVRGDSSCELWNAKCFGYLIYTVAVYGQTIPKVQNGRHSSIMFNYGTPTVAALFQFV